MAHAMTLRSRSAAAMRGTIFRAGSKKMRFSPSRSDVSSITFQTFSPTMTPESGA